MITCTELKTKDDLLRIGSYLLLEVETTGPDPVKDGIIELGMMRVEDDQIVNRASTVVDPGLPIPAEVTERTGIGEADAAKAPSAVQIAGSLEGLLVGSAVVTEADQIAFVRALLEENGRSGEFFFIDSGKLALELFPELPDRDSASLAFLLDVPPEEELAVLQRALVSHYVFQRWKRPPEPAPQEEEEPAEREKRTLEHRAPVWVRRLKRLIRTEQFTLADRICAVAAALCLLGSLLLIPALSGFLLLLAAVVLLPLSSVRGWLRHWGLRGWGILVFAGVLLLLALLLRPVSSNARRPNLNQDGAPAFIILSWDDPGEYGTKVTEELEPGYPTTHIEYHLPAGIYRVLNNNAAAATVSVFDDDGFEREEDEEEAGTTDASKGNSSVTVLANKSKELAVDEHQHVRLSDKSANVVFQYLSPIPVEEEKEREAVNSLISNEPQKIAYVTGEEVRLRKNPSVSAFIMGTFNTGKEVIVTGTTGDWTAVTVDNMKGYIYSKYLSEAKPME